MSSGPWSLGGIIFAKMLATGKEKDPAIDADPELLQKARLNPKGDDLLSVLRGTF
jgi:hypothetical protein